MKVLFACKEFPHARVIGGAMRVVAFLTEHAVVDRIIEHLKLTFVSECPPPPLFLYGT